MPMPSLGLLLMKKKSPDETDDEPMDEGHDKKEVCRKITKSLIDAIHDKDVDEACQCLKDLIDLLKDGDDEEEAGDDGDKDSY